jgi:ubiquinone/menaquinone biosynthesis C-methylase UbiE
MDKTDHTPKDFTIRIESSKERAKSIIRGYVYPLLTWAMNVKLSLKYNWSTNYHKLYLGQRGNDYSAHRRKVNNYLNIRDKNLLIVGCGTGSDLDSWLKYKPKKVIAIDLFNYSKAWEIQSQYFFKKYNVVVDFIQANLTSLDSISDESIDIIGSDAVFEHLNEFDKCLKEMRRVLSNDGLLYSTFGPLWNCWGGDHISGSDDFNSGYNHILLNKSEYKKYLNQFGKYSHDSNDGRTWIYNDLFSYFKPSDYVQSLNNFGFSFLWKSVILDPRAIKFIKFSGLDEEFIKKGLTDEELLISGMTIIVKK